MPCAQFTPYFNF